MPYDQALPAEVGRFAADLLNLHDINGGVMEWVDDCWSNDHRGAPSDGRAWSEEGCAQRVLRGGSWRNDDIRHLHQPAGLRLRRPLRRQRLPGRPRARVEICEGGIRGQDREESRRG